MAAEITSSQSWNYRLRSQKEQLLGKVECLANCSVCIGLFSGARLAAAICWLALSLVLKLCKDYKAGMDLTWLQVRVHAVMVSTDA